MPDNRKPLIYGAFPVCRNYTVRAQLCQLAAGQRRPPQTHSGVVGAQRLYHHGEHLRPLGLQVQDHFGAGDGDRACSTGGRRIRKPLEGGLSRKAERKTKVCFDHLLLEKGIRKKPIIGLITGFFGVIAKHYRYRSKPQFAEKIIGRIYLPTSNL